MMMASYFADRKQRVKIDHIKGKLMSVVRGSSQGSLIGRNVNDYDVNIINVLYHDAAMLIFNSFIVSQ